MHHMWQRRGILSYIIRVTIFVGIVFSLAACSSQSFTLAHDPTPYYREQPTEYYLYLPANYSAEKEWPVFVGIHGFGSDGTACLEMWQEYADREGFVLVCPSLGDENGGWYQDTGEKILLGVLKKVQQECRVQDKVFLAGFSAGAQFVQGFAFAYSQFCDRRGGFIFGELLRTERRCPGHPLFGGDRRPG